MAFFEELSSAIANAKADMVAKFSNAPQSTLKKNPYRFFYYQGLGKDDKAGRGNYGFIFGKPFRFSKRCDPAERVYQKTILRHNTLINIIPGVPSTDSEKLDKAKELLVQYQKDIEDLEADLKTDTSGNSRAKLNEKANETIAKLVENKCDLRYLIFKEDPTNFFASFLLLVNRVGSAIFGLDPNFALQYPIRGDEMSRGYKFWAEKSTSISEDASNSFQQSLFAQQAKQASNLVKQLRFAGANFIDINAVGDTTETYMSQDEASADTATLTALAKNTLMGATYQFPDVFDSSEFSRNYNISFKFQSPYGDDRSIFYNVIVPFLFLLTCSLPKQEGPSGVGSPFILQVDSPGYFNCAMGVVTSLSFTKGGDEHLFNRRGLPLVIEGTMTIRDLYANLSLPGSYVNFGTNLGTVAFLNNLGGLALYQTIDRSILNSVSNAFNDIVGNFISPIVSLGNKTAKISRMFGIAQYTEGNIFDSILR